MVAFAGRARFTGVNSGGGERMGDEVCGVEHPDTKRAGELRGRDSSGAEPPGLPPRGRRSHVSQTVVCRHMLIGYARVSKTDGSQSLDLQRDALRAAGVDDAVNLYHDLASGVRDDRPGLDSCLRALRKGDVLVVWKLDRLGHNLAHLVNTVQDLSARGGRPAGPRRRRGADRHHHRGRPPRVRHLRGAGRVRAGADPGTHRGRAQGRTGPRAQGWEEVRAIEGPGAAGPGRDGAPRHVGVPDCAACSASGR